MSIDKHIGAFSHIESKKKFQYMRNLMKQTANMRKNATSFRPKKHQDENASEASDFLSTRFQMLIKHFEPVTVIRNNYMVLQEVEKRTPTALSQARKKAPINQVFFHQIAKSRFFLINPRTIPFARTNDS